MYKLASFPIRKRAVAALITVAIGYVFLTISSRLMSVGFGSITQVYMRLLGGSILSALVLRKSVRWDRLAKAPLTDYLILLLMGTIGYSVGVYFITLASLKTTLLNISVLLAVQPFIVMFYSLLVFREKIKPKLLIFLILSFLGVAIVSTKSFIPQLSHVGAGEIFVLLAAVCWGWYSICRRLLSKHFNTSEVTVVVMPIAFVSAFVFALIKQETFSVSSFFNWQVLLGLAIGSGLNLVSAQFENFAYANLELVFASQILLLENFFSPIFGWLLYNELVTLPQVIGALLIVASVYAANKIANT